MTPEFLQARVEGSREVIRWGEFDLLEEIGRGMHGTVFRAVHRPTTTGCALKVLREAPDREQGEARFQREVGLLRQLSHPGIVGLIAAGVHEGSFFQAAELVEGDSLAELVAQRGPCSPGLAIRIAARLAHALDYAHQQGVVHRDLKPENVLLHRDGRPRLVDFGLAKDLSAAELTRSGVMIGTPLFAAPEQLEEAKRVDGRADVYSLGALLHFSITGRPPHAAASLAELCLSIRSDPLPLLSAATLEEPALSEVNEILACSLAVDRAERAQMCELAEMLDAALERIGGPEDEPLPPPPPDPDPERPSSIEADRAPEEFASSPSGGLGRRVAALLVLVAIGTALGLALRGWRDAEHREAAIAEHPTPPPPERTHPEPEPDPGLKPTLPWVLLAWRDVEHPRGRRDGTSWTCGITNDEPGYMAVSPAASLVSGPYQARFLLAVDTNQTSRLPVVTLEAVDAVSGRVLATRAVSRREFTAPVRFQEASLQFQVPPATPIRLRVYWQHQARVWLERITTLRIRSHQTQGIAPATLRLTLEAEEDLAHGLGRAEEDGWSATPETDSAGHLCYGPHLALAPGSYRAEFRLRVGDAATGDPKLVTIDVNDASSTGRLLVRRSIWRHDFGSPGSYRSFGLEFESKGEREFEFRTFWHGNAQVRLDRVRIEPIPR